MLRESEVWLRNVIGPMTSRISALESVDPISVPLPHGTEVTTRVARVHGEKEISQGLIGRVAREREGGFDIHITGIGEVWYRREEILPRRVGQLTFAMRARQTDIVPAFG